MAQTDGEERDLGTREDSRSAPRWQILSIGSVRIQWLTRRVFSPLRQ